MAYIAAMILSLLIIYSGAGVSIIQYCCASCETVHSCCDTGCPKCQKSHTCESEQGCKEEGCTATLYKLDLMQQHASELTVSVPVISLFCQQVVDLLAFASVEKSVENSKQFMPPPICSRQKLALYSTFLI